MARSVDDAAFLAEAKTAQLDLDPLPGETLQEIVAKVENVPPAVVDAARKYSEVK